MGIPSRKKYEPPEMNLIPFMNLMSALIPFLLVFSVFTQLAIIDINLPAEPKPGQKKKPKEKKRELLLTVTITNEGFTIAAADAVLPKIAKTSGEYDYAGLVDQLSKIKEAWSSEENVSIVPEPEIHYEIMVAVMDKCRENGFPNISLGAIM